MNTLIYISFWISSFIILTLLMYPVISFLKAKYSKPATQIDSSFEQPVSIIISCYNEEKFIKNKILSIINEEEWIEGSELFVVSTGSNDNTDKILMEFSNQPNVNIIIKKEKTGKISAVNLATGLSKNDILVFSDCRQIMEKGSIKSLVRNFSDESIGTVTASLIDTKQEKKPSLMRKIFYSTALNDSKFSSCLNVYGALYAQRKSVYKEIPSDLLFDDLYVVVSTLCQNKRLIQDKNAIIYDVNFDSYYQKERIERLTRGLLLFLSHYFKLIKALPFKTLVRFIIYKYLKLIIPYFVIIFCFSSVLILLNEGLQMLLLSILTLFIGLIIVKKTRRFILLIFRINYYFIRATFRYYFKERQSNSWEKLQFKS